LGFSISQRSKLVEKIFGWIKRSGLRKTKFRGRRVGWAFCLADAAANLIGLAKLISQES
jgi:hypothetical protein